QPRRVHWCFGPGEPRFSPASLRVDRAQRDLLSPRGATWSERDAQVRSYNAVYQRAHDALGVAGMPALLAIQLAAHIACDAPCRARTGRTRRRNPFAPLLALWRTGYVLLTILDDAAVLRCPDVATADA